jgi:toxin YoeB
MSVYKIKYTKAADRTLAKYRKSNKAAGRKFKELLIELEAHPRTGTGHPEPLTKGQNTRFSRRINKNNRIIYDIFDKEIVVLILVLEGHYGDK